MNDRRIKETGRRPWMAEMKTKITGESKFPCGFARRVLKCDPGALPEVFLNIAVVLVLVISVSGF